MFTTTTLHDSRPALLALSSLAAATALYGIYLTYTHHHHHSHHSHLPHPSSLSRSNAIHRPRPLPPKIDITPPDPDHPFGTMILSRGSTSLMFPIGTVPAPTEEEVTRLFGASAGGEVYGGMLLRAAETIIEVCARPVSEGHGERLGGMGFEGLCVALGGGDGRGVMAGREVIEGVLGVECRGPVEAALLGYMRPRGWGVDVEGTENEEGVSERGHSSDGLRGLLYYIAEEDAKRKAFEHRGIRCEICSEEPIRGVRYHCLNCPDYDLCATCEANEEHIRTHVMAKIKIPLPVLSQPALPVPSWYAGDPDKESDNIEHAMRKSMAEQYQVEEAFVDALLEQFKSIADTTFLDDPSKIRVAISYRAFWTALTPSRWKGRFRPNALIDRMFTFYDADGNSLIDFKEFIDGWAYLRGPRRKDSLTRALQGYDTDNDGYLSRKDFMRLNRARYELNKQLVRDMVKSREDEHTLSAMSTLHSSAPISSIFNQDEIPRGDTQRLLRGKWVDERGETQAAVNAPTVLPDDAPWLQSLPANVGARERLAHHLSRFEEIINSPSQPTNGEASSSSRPPPSMHSVMAKGAHTQDALWAVVEEGLQELLHRLFLSKENVYKEVIATREERSKWKAQIGAMLEGRKAALEEVESSNPQISAALSTKDVKVEEKKAGSTTANMNLVPTDEESLTTREHEITERSLEELLNSAGYSTVDETSTEAAKEEDSMNSWDPTMPQFRPNEGDPPPAEKREEAVEEPPTRTRLEYLSLLNDEEAEIQNRGGPGRLSFDEIEAIVRADASPQGNSSTELREMIFGWLAWASF